MKAIPLLVIMGAMAACGADGSSKGRVETAESAQGAAFAKYHTFAFRPAGQPTPPFEVSARAFEVERRIRPLIVNELLRKGYTEQNGAEKPDFVVVFGLGYATEAPPPADQDRGVPAHPPIETGRIAVDAFDTSTDTQVWHGTAEAVVDPEKIDDQLLQTAIQKLLAPFPGRTSASVAQAP